MKYSKTTLMELSHKYSSILKKCAFLNAAILMSVVVETPSMAASPVDTWAHPEIASYTVVNNDVNYSLNTGSYNLITGTAVRNTVNGNVNLTLDGVTQVSKVNPRATSFTETNVIGSLFIPSTGGYLHAGDLGVEVPTDAKTKAIQQLVNGNVNVTVSNSTIEDSVIGVNFYAANTEITNAGVSGKTTVTVNNSNVAKSVRGTNYRDINTNEPKAKVGDIELNINNSLIQDEVVSAGSAASAGNVVINVTGDSVIGYTTKESDILGGEENGWILAGANRKGARIASTEVNLNTSGRIRIATDIHIGSRDRRPGTDTDEGSVTGNATLNMLGGGTIDVGGNLRAYHVAGTTALNINNVTANVGGVADEFDTISLGEGAKLNLTGTLAMKEGSTLNVADLLNGTIISGGTIKANGATLDSTSFVVSKAGTYTFATSNFIDGDNISTTDDDDFNLSDSIKTAIDNNLLYDISYEKGKFTVDEREASDIAEDVMAGAATAQEANTVAAVAGADSTHPVVASIKEALQTGNATAAAKAAKDLAPTTSQQVMGIAQSVNTLLNNVAGARMAALGKAGGDAFIGGSTWVQGLYNHTKQDKNARTDGFRANTRGIAFGIDGKINEAITIGIGYGYTDTTSKSGGQKVDVDGNNFFAYAQYQPDAWYINGMFSYGFSKYTEEKAPAGYKLKSKYDVDSYAVNVMTGYQFESGFTPELGLRYILADQDSYSDGVQRISADKNDVLTGVVGVKYTTNMKAKDWTFKPNLRLAATYDMISDNSKANVNIIGGGNYQITGDRLHRFGIEAGIGVGATYGDWDLMVDYNGGIRKDFTSHTGTIKAKYNF